MAIISPIETSANNIVKIGLRSSNSLPRARNEFNQFLNFLDIRKIELEKTKLPEEREIKKLSNINLVSTFGSLGGLLSSLLGGGLDLAGLVRGMFSEKGKKVGGPSTSPTRPQKPKVSGNKLKIGGLRAIGITNALFAGLDFATGLQEGESVGKAAAGAGGSLAGSLLGGAIGQALIPIPGVGFVLGSMAGGFLGGWTGDRVYESVSGEGSGSSIEERTGERLKEQEERQKKAIRKGDGGFEEILMKFSDTVDKFENFAMNFGQIMGVNEDNPYDEPSEYPDFPEDSGELYEGPVDGDTFFPLPGGDVGTNGNISPGQAFGAPRDGGTRSHAGLDMTHQKGALDAPVVAYKTGKVVWASASGSYNSGVMVDHGNGLKTKYFHVTPLVKTGDIVYGGQQIAKLFPAGQSTHLHFEVHKNGTPTNPLNAGVGPGGKAIRLPSPLSKDKAKEHSGTNNVTGSEVERKKMGTDLYMPQQTESEVQSRSQDSTQSFRNLTSSAGMPSQVSMMQSLPQSVMAASPRQVPQIQSYPSYSQGQSYIIERPIMMMSNTPSVNPSGSNIAMVPTSNGGSSSSGPNMGQIVNSLVKSMLLTNLSSS
jgi:murein DD-endopeptidase MepM/ murein hydrolase activator NlpD